MAEISDQILDKAFDTVIKDMSNKNIITQGEFRKFQPLFDNAIRIDNTINQGDIEKLLAEYRTRFIAHLPIVVTTDDGKHIIEERAPMLLQVPTLNKHVPRSGQLMTEFDNIMNNPSQPVQKKEQISSILHKALDHSIQSDETYKKSRDRAIKLVEKHDGTMSLKKKEQQDSPSPTEGMEWK